MDPNFGDARFENGLLLAEVGDYDAAFDEVTKGLALTGNSTKIKSGLGIVHARAGDGPAARKVIAELVAESRDKYVSPMDIAIIYSVMNDRDKAFEWLEKAYLERTPWLFELKVTPEFKAIRDDPRFDDLARRVGL
jgi:tetratricopeptide (TPR) repeat protein